jgi:hypothetical protein
MTTYNRSFDLVYTISYQSSRGSQNCAVGDTINMTVDSDFFGTYADPRVSEANGDPALGQNKSSPHTFSYTVPYPSQSTSAHTVTFYFFGSIQSSGYSSATNRLWNYQSPYNFYRREGSFTLNVAAYSSDCALTAPSGTINATVASNDYTSTPVATVSGLSASGGCAIKIRATEQSQYNAGNYAAWGANGSLTYTVTRGSTYIFQAAQVGTATPVLNTSSPILIPYTVVSNTGLSVTNITTSNGQFTFTVNGVNTSNGLNNTNGNTNKYFLRVGNVYPLNSQGNLVSSPPGNHTITSDLASNVPAGTTVTYQVWGKRSFGAGGGTGRGQDTITNVTNFNVTHTAASTFNEIITHPTGTYFDRNGLIGGVSSQYLFVSGLDTTKYYNVRKPTGGNFLTPNSGAWTSPSNGSPTYVVTDTPTAATGTGSTTVSYQLWRSDNANGSGGLAISGSQGSYTRTLVSQDRFGFGTGSVQLQGGVSQFSQTVSNTIVGHTYVIRRGTSTNVSNTVTATGTSTTFSVTESSLGTANGSGVIHTLWTQSPFNFPSLYSTAKTYPVTRIATVLPGTFGMQVFADDGVTKLYDTIIRTARLWAAGTTGTVVSNGTVSVTVTGMTSDTSDFVVSITHVDNGNGQTTSARQSAHLFQCQQNNGGFVITNQASFSQTYKWHVMRTGGT